MAAARELETLSEGVDTAPALVDPSRRALLLRKVGLRLSSMLFLVGCLSQVVIVLWLVLLAGLAAGGGWILAKASGLDEHFAVSSFAAAVIVVCTFIGVAIAWGSRRARAALSDPSPDRRPLAMASLAMVLLLLGASSFGFLAPAFFPPPIVAVAVLANTFFFAILLVIGTGAAMNRARRRLGAWASLAPYRAGFVTATLLVLAIGGFVAYSMDWYATPAQLIAQRLHLADVDRPDGVLDAEADVFCIAARTVDPEDANEPACAPVRDPDAVRRDDCFMQLTAELSSVRSSLRSTGRQDADIDDAISDAMIATCIRDRGARNLGAYFNTAAHNALWRRNDRDRSLDCFDDERHETPSADPAKRLDDRECIDAIAATFCTFDRKTEAVVRRRVERGEDFATIGRRLALRESQARSKFDYAVRKLRTKHLDGCFDNDSAY